MRVTKKEKQKHSIVSWNIANTTTTASLESVKKSEKKLTNRQTHECSKTKSIYVYAEILAPHRCIQVHLLCVWLRIHPFLWVFVWLLLQSRKMYLSNYSVMMN